jgi:hypothetical protein
MLLLRKTAGGNEMNKETVLKAYPHIPSDAELGVFLFFVG